MKINKKILFIPILGFGYAVLLSFLEHDRKDEILKAIAIVYHLICIAFTGIIAQHLHPY